MEKRTFGIHSRALVDAFNVHAGPVRFCAGVLTPFRTCLSYLVPVVSHGAGMERSVARMATTGARTVAKKTRVSRWGRWGRCPRVRTSLSERGAPVRFRLSPRIMGSTCSQQRAMAPLKDLVEQLIRREDLSRTQACEAVEGIIAGADSHLAAAFLVLLRAKGETPQEVAGMVEAMRKHMIPVVTSTPTLDIVGTGGDGAHTLNFSTGASLVAASCGAPIAKVRCDGHGPRRGRPCAHASAAATARQPLRVEQVRLCGRASRAGHTPRAVGGGDQEERGRGGDRLHVRAHVPPGDEDHHARAEGARCAHGLQHPGATTQPR